MFKTGPQIEMLQRAAKGLGDLVPDVVFVGGATSVLYVDPKLSAEPRPTDDVDCVVEVATQWEKARLDEKLRALKFSSDRDVICRWHYSGLIVDVMPIDPSILGFSNRWYPHGVANKEERVLPNGQPIFAFPLPFFIAAKLEAYHSRGQHDARTSSYIEDILLVLDGNPDPLVEIRRGNKDVRLFLADEMQALKTDPGFLEAVDGFLYPDRGGRIRQMLERLDAISKPDS